MRGVLRQAHALHAAGDDDGALAGADLLRGQRHGAQAGAADLVDAERGLGSPACRRRGRPGGPGSGPRRRRAPGRGSPRPRPPPRCRRARIAACSAMVPSACADSDAERAVEAADRRARGGDDDDVVHMRSSLPGKTIQMGRVGRCSQVRKAEGQGGWDAPGEAAGDRMGRDSPADPGYFAPDFRMGKALRDQGAQMVRSS